MDKVRYFLKTFKGREWSGPAWYSHTKDENGFPSIIKLEYFHPLDLGTSAHTEWDGEDLMKIFKVLRKEFPQIGKTWVQGNIHSHHEMGSFFSQTDVQQCIDGANEQFYYSLVVSTKPGKELHFGTSYPDQFGQIHVVEIDDIEVEENSIVEPAWKKQAKLIEKNNKTQYVTRYGNYNNQLDGQATLFGESAANDKHHRTQTSAQTAAYYSAMFEDDKYDAQLEAYDQIMLDYERGRIKKRDLNKTLKDIGVNRHGEPLPQK